MILLVGLPSAGTHTHIFNNFVENSYDERTTFISLFRHLLTEENYWFCNCVPFLGKTTWAKKYAAEHPEKKYEIINAAIYLEKATVNGESRKQHTQVRDTFTSFIRYGMHL